MASPPITSRPPPLIPEHELLVRIGAGSFGEVWLAQNRLGTLRAVKVVYRDRFESDRAWEREMKGLRQFEPLSRTHDGLVDILQVGQSEAEGWAYCVMELADAVEAEREKGGKGAGENRTLFPSLPFSPANYVPRTLASDLRQHDRLSVSECVSLGLALADGLAHLHRHGLLHRDVKPANIVFVDGVPKLADIGLVATVKEAGSFVGTRGFMPPEGHQDGSGDVFSLGKVLYECAWGRDRLDFPELPTDAADWAEHPQLIELNEVILKATEPHRERRYASIVEMREDLALLQQGHSVRRLRRLEKHRRRVTRIAAAAVILASLAVAGFFFQQNQSRRLQRLADENRDRLVQLQVANGVRHMDEGDFSASALWFSEALHQVAGDPEREWVHRRRLHAVLERSPQLIALGAHQGRIRSVQFSPDGRLFATAGTDGAVKIWNATNGTATGIVLRHETPVHNLQFSPDGRWLATAAEDYAARVWSVASGEMPFATTGHVQFVNAVRFSKDGQWLVTASEDHTAQIWNAATGQPKGDAFRHDGPANDAEFSRQGDLLATASDDDTARVWDLRTGLPVGQRMNHDHDVRSVRFSPDGKYLVTASKDGAARVWDVASGNPITPPLQHFVPLWTAEFSPDGQTVMAAGGDGDGGGTARLWDAATGEPRTPPLRHGNTIRSACFSPDGRWVVTASHDRSVCIWDAGEGARIGSPLRSTHFMKWVSFSPDGKRLLAAGEDEMWRLWDLAAMRGFGMPESDELPFSMAEFSPDGRLILGVTTNQTAVISDGSTFQIRSSLGQQPASVVWIRFSPDSRRALTLCADGEVRAWNTVSGKPIGRPMKHGAATRYENRAEFSPDGKLIATVIADKENRSVKVWDLEASSECILDLKHTYPAKSLAFSPDGRSLLTGSGDRVKGAGEARLWSLRTGQLLSNTMPHPGIVQLVTWSRDGRHFFTACDSAFQGSQSGRVWDSATGQSVVLSSLTAIRFISAAFSLDGRFIATGADNGEIRLWHVENGRPASRVFGHQRACWTLKFSPDGRQLASSSFEPGLRLWEPVTGEPLSPPLKLGATPTGVSGLSFSPAGDSMILYGGGRATVWRLGIAESSVKRLQELSRLASACRLNEMGGIEPLPSSKLADLLKRSD
jgi:WD40 repeat protein/serine/threonine protein kinase